MRSFSIKKIYKKLTKESIYANSSYLLSSWTLLAVFGFGFWTICAHLYSDEQVGLATGLLAALNLITSLSLIGFEMSIIRFLPKCENKNVLLNTCYSLAAAAGIIITGIFFILQPYVSSKLDVIHSSAPVIFLFFLFVVASIGGFIVESTFIAYREARYVLRKNFVFSLLKLVLPFLFLGLGAFGIYSAYMLSLTGAVAYSMLVLARRFNHSFRPKLGIAPLKGMLTFSFGNYVDGFIEGLPVMVLPVMIINIFGADEAAHYYIAMMLASFLFTVSTSATQSMFAEGSYEEQELRDIIAKVLKFLSFSLGPGIIAMVLLGSFILSLFGKGYSGQASGLLDILAASAILMALNSIARTVYRINFRIISLTIISTVGSLAIIALAYFFRGYGLNGIGLAWLIGQLVTLTAFAFLLLWQRLKLGHRLRLSRTG